MHSEPRAGLLPTGVGSINGGRGDASWATARAYVAVRSRHTLAPPLVLATMSSSTAANAANSASKLPRASCTASRRSSISRNQPAAGPLFPWRDLHSCSARSVSDSNSVRKDLPCAAGRDCFSAVARLSAHKHRLTCCRQYRHRLNQCLPVHAKNSYAPVVKGSYRCQ